MKLTRSLLYLRVFIIFFCFLIFSSLSMQIWAGDMNSDNFNIHSGTINITGGDKSSENFKISDTVGQLAAGEFQSRGYTLRAGFQYIRTADRFSFSVSKTNIDLGVLTPRTPSLETNTLTVFLGRGGQYQVTAIEETPLLTASGEIIPDTRCDGGRNSCDEVKAAAWLSDASYGFGYNMSGNKADIPSDFIDANFYRTFPDKSAKEPPVVIMSNRTSEKNRQAVMTFKANISAEQEPGSYQTVINYVATPGF